MLNCQRDLFQLDEEEAFLNCAYMSPQLKAVEAAGRHALERKNRPYRIHPEDFFEPVSRVKSLFAQLIHCAEPERIAIIPSASYGLASVAKNIALKAGDEIVVLQDQFPSNYYCWQRLAAENGGRIQVVGVEEGPGKGRRWNEALLEAISSRTAIVAVPQVHWAEGVLFDLIALRKRCFEVEAKLIVDATQSVGAYQFDQKAIQADAVICAAYKWLLGPYSIGVAYYGPEFDDGTPIEENWINRLHSEDFRGLVNYESGYQSMAGRYSMGEQSNFIQIPMLETALSQILAWGVSNIQEYCRTLNEAYLREVSKMGIMTLPAAQRVEHLLGLGLPTHWRIQDLREALAKARVHISFRGNSIRVSPHLYNRRAEWGRLLQVLNDYQKSL